MSDSSSSDINLQFGKHVRGGEVKKKGRPGRKKASGSDKPRLRSYVKPNEFQKTALLKKMLDLRDDLFGPISMVGRTQQCKDNAWQRVLAASKEIGLDFTDVNSIKKAFKNWKRKALAENDKRKSSGAGPHSLTNVEELILEVSGKSSAMVQLHRGVSESGINRKGHQGHSQKCQPGRSNDVPTSK